MTDQIFIIILFILHAASWFCIGYMVALIKFQKHFKQLRAFVANMLDE